MAIDSMQKMVKIARVVLEISSRTDRQTNTHTHTLITVLRNRPQKGLRSMISL